MWVMVRRLRRFTVRRAAGQSITHIRWNNEAAPQGGAALHQRFQDAPLRFEFSQVCAGGDGYVIEKDLVRLELWRMSYQAIRPATVEEIEKHLVNIGSKNHADNMQRVREAPRHYFGKLPTKESFLELVFGQFDPVTKIAPVGEDRRLLAVAVRAAALPADKRRLGVNWDLAEVQEKFRSCLENGEPRFPPLLLRETRGAGERRWAAQGWYLQDGSHRALGYALALHSGEISYRPQFAFCVTNRNLPFAEEHT